MLSSKQILFDFIYSIFHVDQLIERMFAISMNWVALEIVISNN